MPPPGEAGRPPGWFAELEAVARDLPGLIGDRVDLLSLELQRAGIALAHIVALVVVASILGVTAWMALWVGIAFALVSAGLHWGAAVAIVLVVHALALWLAVARIQTLLPKLSLSATRRHLSFKPRGVSKT